MICQLAMHKTNVACYSMCDVRKNMRCGKQQPALNESPITAKCCCPVGMKNEVKNNVSEIHLLIFVIQRAGLEMDINKKN